MYCLSYHVLKSLDNVTLEAGPAAKQLKVFFLLSRLDNDQSLQNSQSSVNSGKVSLHNQHLIVETRPEVHPILTPRPKVTSNRDCPINRSPRSFNWVSHRPKLLESLHTID